MDRVNIPILLGANRKLRKSVFAAKWLMREIEKRNDMETKLFDVSDFALPRDDYGQEIKAQFPDWRNAIVAADGLIIVTPEYNHGYPGALKSVLDLLLREYVHKTAAFVGVSAGPWGGTRVIEALLPTVRELGLAATFTDLNFPYVQKVFSDGGELLDQAFENRAKDFLNELVWMSCGLRWARQNLPSKYHDIG